LRICDDLGGRKGTKEDGATLRVGKQDLLYLELGILGATVMPHNLYLHSGIVQTRAYGQTVPEKREALTVATRDSMGARGG
ncbi:divalent metal cation transporter, partial [Rhizobium ruizarguesonis]